MKNKLTIFPLIVFSIIFTMITIIFMVAFIAQPLQAAPAGQIFLESKVDKAEVTIGDPIHYSLTANMQRRVSLSLPQLGSNLGEFDILDYQVTGPSADKGVNEGRIIQTITYTIAAYDTGVHHIPPMEIRYKTPEGEEKTISAEGIDIKIRALAPEKAADIKDIKGPLEMVRNWAPYRKALFWMALGLFLAVLAFWGIWYYRKKHASMVGENKLTLLPAHEVAIAELKKIGETLLANNQIREFYFRLSEIIRQYFSLRYQINALEATTEELIRDLEDQPIPPQPRALILDFLNGCDLVKFAKYVPQRAENEQFYQMAFQIVDNTRATDDTVSAAMPSEASTQQMQSQQTQRQQG
jgi:hypothetical protein